MIGGRLLSASAAAISSVCVYHYLVEDIRSISLYGKVLEVGVRALRGLDAERSHGLGIAAASLGLCSIDSKVNSPVRQIALGNNVCGQYFRNPLGLAAGFDKQGEAMGPLLEAGFGFVEVGTVTPLPQPGNPTPRMFRLPGDSAVINRFGFNSDGALAVGERLSNFWGPLLRAGVVPGSAGPSLGRGLVGVNIGKNKEGGIIEDYTSGVAALSPFADYLVVNVSSPNTPGLRALQGREALRGLLRAVKSKRDALPWGVGLEHKHENRESELEAVRNAVNSPSSVMSVALVAARKTPPPLWVKIAPDLSEDDLQDIVAVVREEGVDGIVVSNTTTSRPATLSSPSDLTRETGGLSGQPLFTPSTMVLVRF